MSFRYHRVGRINRRGSRRKHLDEQKGNIYYLLMSTPLLTRARYTEPPGLPFLGDLTLAGARVHEFCGPARRTLALMAARQLQGPVFWIRTKWQGDRLHGPGITRFIDPSRLTFITPKRLEDCLWSMEECLRAGCVPLVVTELPDPPVLTPIRRLHLAAEAGAKRGTRALGLILLPGDGGAQGVETRWYCAPTHIPDADSWHLQRRRARIAPPAAWDVEWRTEGPELHNRVNGPDPLKAVQPPPENRFTKTAPLDTQ